jgi:hypothetical protein
MIMMMTCPCPGAGMSWNLDFLSMSISAGCVSDPGRGTWMVLLSAGILFCWAGSVDEDGICGYLLRGGISWVLGRTFIGKILTVCRRRILQSLMEIGLRLRPGDFCC